MLSSCSPYRPCSRGPGRRGCKGRGPTPAIGPLPLRLRVGGSNTMVSPYDKSPTHEPMSVQPGDHAAHVAPLHGPTAKNNTDRTAAHSPHGVTGACRYVCASERS
eukprot:2213945-Prymnesium_polylepis.1